MLYSKLDLILKPFLNLHFNHSLFSYLNSVFKVVSIPLEETKNQPNGFLRFIHRAFIVTLGIFLCIIASPLYIALYLITAIVTFTISTIIVLGLGLFYGLCPFVLPENANYSVEETNQKEYKGYNKLLEPISWSGVFFNKIGKYLFGLGIRPINRIQSLNEADYQTHILERIALTISTAISFVLYSIIICGLVQFFANFFIFVIVAVSTVIWMIIYVFDILFKTLFNKEGN